MHACTWKISSCVRPFGQFLLTEKGGKEAKALAQLDEPQGNVAVHTNLSRQKKIVARTVLLNPIKTSKSIRSETVFRRGEKTDQKGESVRRRAKTTAGEKQHSSNDNNGQQRQ